MTRSSEKKSIVLTTAQRSSIDSPGLLRNLWVFGLRRNLEISSIKFYSNPREILGVH